MTGAPTSDDPPDPLIGRRMGRYTLVRRIGRGGMGAVYGAVHDVMKNEAAVKVLLPGLSHEPSMIERFLREARSAAAIAHENVIKVFDCERSAEGFVYLAMELLRGSDLAAVLEREGALPWVRARAIAVQIGRALRAAHDRGIIHRDLKPENIFLVPRDDGSDLVKLLDFGLAKVIADSDLRLTRTGGLCGTPQYMSPEQIQTGPVDCRTDVYSFGAVLYHMLTGSVPFPAGSSFSMLAMHLAQAPVPPSVLRPELRIPGSVELVVLRALEKAPARRWQTVSAMTKALEACTVAPDSERNAARPIARPAPAPSEVPAGTQKTTWRPWWRHPHAVGAGIAVLAALAVGLPLAAFVWLPAPATAPPSPNRPPAAERRAGPATMPLDILIQSIPDGAHVWLANTNQYLGKTPFRQRFLWTADRQQILVFRLDGYQEVTKEVKPTWVGLIHLKPNETLQRGGRARL